MNRILRIDDYPHGNRETFKTKPRQVWRRCVQKALSPFEACGLPYLLGVSPLLLLGEDIDWLNKFINSGSVVMHGFDHFWSFMGMWSDIHDTWLDGGEVRGRTVDQLRALYLQSHTILSQIGRYNPAHFIPPFNTISQDLLTAFQDTPVQFIHGVDIYHRQFGYDQLQAGRLRFLLSEWQVTYAHAHVVLDKFRGTASPITLHWAFDLQFPGWQNTYAQLAAALKEEQACG